MDAKLLITFVFENCSDGLASWDGRLILSPENRVKRPEIWRLVEAHQDKIRADLRRQVREYRAADDFQRGK